jgi:hypothetical protein
LRCKRLQPRSNTVSILKAVGEFVSVRDETHHATTFLTKADPMLVALVKDFGLTLVTEEKHHLPQGDGSTGRLKGEPRLPFWAFAFDVRCVPSMTAPGEAS